MHPQNPCSSYTRLAIMSNSKTHGQRPCTKPDSSTCAKSVQSCLTLCDPVDCSWPGTSVRGIPQARILVVVVQSLQSCLTLCDDNGLQHARLPCPSPPRRACSNSLQVGSLPLAPPGKPDGSLTRVLLPSSLALVGTRESLTPERGL